MRQLAIGDIHGCLKLFEGLLEQMQFGKNDELFLLGDYVDRGEDSKGVIDKILELRHNGFKINCLMGNHELMLLEAYFKYKANSGYPDGVCLHSFGVDYGWKIPKKYILFFESLPFYIVTDNYILVHAGLNFDGQDPFSDTNAMAWLGYWYDSIDRNWLNGKIILHGHTPQSKQNIEKMFKRLDYLPALNLDCRAFHSKQDPSKYALCGFDMTNQKLYFQSE